MSGFTLLEVMFGIMFMSVALLGFASLTTYTIKGNSGSRAFTSASVSNISQFNILKNLALTDFDHADLTSGVLHVDYLNEDGVVVAKDNASMQYTRSWTVIDDVAPANVKNIAFSVTWSKWGMAKSISYDTILSR